MTITDAGRATFGFATIAVRAGAERDASGAVAPPLYLSTNYEHGPAGERLHDDVYARYSNPTQRRLEAALAAIEGGEAAVAFASGAAAAAACLQALPAGSHVLFGDDLFYGFRALVPSYLPRWGLAWSFADLTDLPAARDAVRPETRLVWAETPSNPLMKIVDVAGLAGVAHAAGARLLVDSTFPTPALQQSLRLGADISLHSTTKYLGGHSDVMGGALIFKREDDLSAQVLQNRTLLGGVASPFSSWLVHRGIRSLVARMARHSTNALAVARALQVHSRIVDVLYPGLPSHPGHEIAARQMNEFGGMLSIRVKGGRAGAVETASRVRLFINAGSLGGPESLIQHAASVMHPADGIPDDLLRLSIGLEDAGDLVGDLKQALA